MQTNIAYEVHCLSDRDSPVGRIGRIQRIPGGLLLLTDTVDVTLPIEDPEEQLIDDWEQGHLEINTPKGRFVLNAIDRAAAEELAPFYAEAPDGFESDEAAQAYYARLVDKT